MIQFDSRSIRILSRLGPSGALGEAAIDLGDSSENILFLTADLCFFSGLERFKEKYPDKLINLGIAEQNMLGVAGGLAKEGYIPFVTTYASFGASRCLDQVRVNMAYMKLPIKMIGLTAGFGAGILGATHMSIEDLSVMRALPNITILSPADCSEVEKCILASSRTNDPTYIRLTGPVNTPIIYKEDYDFSIGKAIKLREGQDVCIIGTGSVLYQGLLAAELLNECGISCSVINMHTIKPIDKQAIIAAAYTHKLLISLEEHSVYGGLGSAISEILVNMKIHPLLEIIGINDFFAKPGDYYYQLEQCGLMANQIANRIKNKVTNIK